MIQMVLGKVRVVHSMDPWKRRKSIQRVPKKKTKINDNGLKEGEVVVSVGSFVSDIKSWVRVI